MSTPTSLPAPTDTGNAPLRGPRVYTADEKSAQEIQNYEGIKSKINEIFWCRNKFCIYAGHVAAHLDDVVHVAEAYMDEFCSVNVEFINGRWIVWADQHSHDGCDNTSEKLFSFAKEVQIAERVARNLNSAIEVER